MTAPWWRRALAGELALAGAAGVAAVVAAAIVLQLWDARLSLPMAYGGNGLGGDGLWGEQIVKGIADHGWLLTNPDVGAPVGQQLHDFTGVLGDSLHYLVIRVMSVVSQDPIRLVDAYFLLGFALCAASACLVLRRLGASRGAAVVAAILFSLLPLHVGGGIGRLTLGAYWSIPLTALLVIRVFGGEPLFARRPSGGRLTRWASRRSLATAALCLLIAGSALYYELLRLRFSYGGVKGRLAGDWPRLIAALPYYVAAGFRGIWVDRRGFADRGAALDVELRTLLKRVPLLSDGGQPRFCSLVDEARDWAAGRTAQALRIARNAALCLSAVRLAPGALEVVNPGSFERTVVVRGRLRVARGGDVAVTAELPDGGRASLRPAGRPRAFVLRVPVAPGATAQVRLRAAGGRGPLELLDVSGADAALRSK